MLKQTHSSQGLIFVYDQKHLSIASVFIDI
jgi:hypothetical protein